MQTLPRPRVRPGFDRLQVIPTIIKAQGHSSALAAGWPPPLPGGSPHQAGSRVPPAGGGEGRGTLSGPYVIACDGDEVHGVIHGLEDAQDGAQRLLQVLSALAALAVFQHFLAGGGREESCSHTHLDTDPYHC